MDSIMLPRTIGLFAVTAIAELLGCYLPMLWLSGKGSPWLMVPAAFSLAIFVWLLTLHPAASGRVYATYGAVYIAAAMFLAFSGGRCHAPLDRFCGGSSGFSWCRRYSAGAQELIPLATFVASSEENWEDDLGRAMQR